MGTRKNTSNEERKVDWEYMTTSYNDMDNTGRNDYINSFEDNAVPKNVFKF